MIAKTPHNINRIHEVNSELVNIQLELDELYESDCMGSDRSGDLLKEQDSKRLILSILVELAINNREL